MTLEKSDRRNARERLEDRSMSVWVLEKIGAPVVVACAVSVLGTAVAQYLQVRELTNEMARVKERVTVLEANVVTMEMLKRIELMLSAYMKSDVSGHGAMEAVAASLRMELESQKERNKK